MKKIKTLIIILVWILLIYFSPNIFAGIVNIEDPSWWIENNSLTGYSEPINDVEKLSLWILWITKLIIQWILIIYIVYAWVMMIMSMWSNEEELSSSKRQIRYALVWILFINIPWTLFNIFNTRWASVWWNISSSSFLSSSNSWILVTSEFWSVFNMIIHFLEVTIFFIAIFMFIIAWIQILTSRWRDEKVKEWKNKIFYWILGLVFVWIIESWKHIALSGSISAWIWLFNTLLQIALFFAWITVILFLTLAAYYTITSWWDEEKIKKSKSIVINTLIGILILIASYTFLVDLITL